MLALWIESGYSERVSSSTVWMYWLTPVDKDRISAMPMMPMLPAKEVSSVRAFLVRRFWKLSARAVANDMLDRRAQRRSTGSSCASGGVNGSESARMTPSLKRTMRVA